MKLCKVIAALLWAAVVWYAVPGRGQTRQDVAEPQDKASQDVIRVDAVEVKMDLVVRDKRGRAVRDLNESEVTVYENGVKQKIIGFRLVEAEGKQENGEAPSNKPARDGATQPFEAVNLVSLVFDGLAQYDRRLASQAALDLVNNQLQPNTLVAVFTVEHKLYALQQFTSDKEALRRAIAQATGGAFTQYAERSADVQRQLEENAFLQGALDASSAASGQGGAPAGRLGDQIAAKVGEIMLNILRVTEMIERAQKSYSSLGSLLALVKEQRALGGRKTVVYFARGLQVPPSSEALFRSVISEANRANVSVYGVDARALLSGSDAEATAPKRAGVTADSDLMLAQAAAASRSQLASRGGRALTREEVFALDTAESSLRLNTQGTLQELADSTGGFLIANTNDFRPGLRRLADDINSYYEITYAPAQRQLDGTFRRIKIEVTRPGIALQTRQGYFAVPQIKGLPLLPFEMPMLAALRGPAPREIDFRIVAARFEPRAAGVQYVVHIEAPLSNLVFAEDRRKNRYRANFSLMAVLRNAEGEIVERLSQDFPLEGDLNRLAGLRRGNVSYSRTFTAPPGKYTLEAVAHDREGNKFGVRRAVVIVPTVNRRLSLSSVSVVKQIVESKIDHITPDAETPLRTARFSIVPYVGEPTLAHTSDEVILHFVVYTFGAAAPPKIELEFSRDGTIVSRSAPELPQADKEGRLNCVLPVPMKHFAPGRYQVKVTARHEASAVEEYAFFTVN